MAIEHLSPGHPVSVRPYAKGIHASQSHALFKSSQLEVIRLVLPAGKTMPDHLVAGEITIQCLEGTIDLFANGSTSRITEGDLVHLAARDPHRLTAIEDASALVTIVLSPP